MKTEAGLPSGFAVFLIEMAADKTSFWYTGSASISCSKRWQSVSDNMTDEVIPHFHNDLGVQFIEIGAKKFMCMGALPPQDHPHVFCDMGEDVEYVCPYCSTLYRHNPALSPNQARPAECEFRDIII